VSSALIEATVRSRFDRHRKLEHRRRDRRLQQQGRGYRDERVGKEGAIVIGGFYCGSVRWSRGMRVVRPVRMYGDTSVMRSRMVIRVQVDERRAECCCVNSDRERNGESLPHCAPLFVTAGHDVKGNWENWT
jgi:hypothetical protein